MSLPRVKITVRGVMLAVAFLASLMGVTREVSRLRRRSREYVRKAVLAGRELREWRATLVARTASEAEARQRSAALRARDPDLAKEWSAEASGCAREIREAREFVAHFAGLNRKYRAPHPAHGRRSRPTRRSLAISTSGAAPRSRRSRCRPASGGILRRKMPSGCVRMPSGRAQGPSPADGRAEDVPTGVRGRRREQLFLVEQSGSCSSPRRSRRTGTRSSRPRCWLSDLASSD